MAYSAHDDPDTMMVRVARVGALTRPVVPQLIWWGRRSVDTLSDREAARAVHDARALVATVVLATLVRLYVPISGFLGTLAQLAVLVVAVFYSVQAHRSVHRGSPASYPIDIKVVKTND